MNKLMIAAASAVIVGSAFAVNKAQVYDFSASVKTTTCRESKVSASLEKYFDHGGQFASWNAGEYEKGDVIGLRKQTTIKIAGVIWGCDCPTIAIPDWRPTDANNPKYFGGYLFWNQSTEELYNPDKLVTTFDWTVLNRIDTMTKAEGAFRFVCLQQDQTIFLLGAGFGTVKGTGCDTYIASMSGNLAGFGAGIDGDFGCVFCAANNCVVGPICDTCVERDTTAYTVGSGTWSLKYNKTAANRLAKRGFLSQSYTFKKAGITQQWLAAAEAAYYADPDSYLTDSLDALAADDDDEDWDDDWDDEKAESGYGDLIIGTDKNDKAWKHLATITDDDSTIKGYDNSGLVTDATEVLEVKLALLSDAKLEKLKVPEWVTTGTEPDEDFAELVDVEADPS